MSDMLERYATVSDGFSSVVDNCPENAWDSPSPCEGWTARDVLAHVIGSHTQGLSRLGIQVTQASSPDGPTAWHATRSATISAMSDPQLASQIVEGPMGTMPFEDIVGTLLSSDTLVHTWDLARATGQDETLDPAAVKDTLAALLPMDESLRQHGMFGPKIEPGPDADEQTRLLAFLGRQV